MLKKIALFGFIYPFFSTACYALDTFSYPFYFGITSGYGATTWQGLVPTEEHQNAALVLSTPQKVTEGGVIWGVFMGYEFIPTFAIEASYTRYPNATVNFDPFSLIAFNNNITVLTTHTDTSALMAKVMLIIPHTTIRGFSSAGPALAHRWDQLNDKWRITPTFAFGLNYNFTPRIMGEIGFSYTGGYGESELNPAEDYMPFLYAAFFHLAYRL